MPVLSTLPPMPIPTTGGQDGDDRIDEANGIIWQVSREMKRAADQPLAGDGGPGMDNEGLASDDLHLGVFGGGPHRTSSPTRPCSPRRHSFYGANRRQLIWLQTLGRLDAVAGIRVRLTPGQARTSRLSHPC